MDHDFTESRRIVKNLKGLNQLTNLKKRKAEIEDEIRKVSDRYASLSIDESLIVPCDEFCISPADVSERVEGCQVVKKVQIIEYEIQEPWGFLMPHFFVPDGLYYLLMETKDWFNYKIFKKKEIRSFWQQNWDDPKFGEQPECDSDNCWYSGNMDRLGEFGCSYTFPSTSLGDSLTFCDVDYENAAYDWVDKFCDYQDAIKEAYKNKVTESKEWKRIACTSCNKVYSTRIMEKCENCIVERYTCAKCKQKLGLSSYEHLICELCDKMGCFECMHKKEQDGSFYHSHCFTPDESIVSLQDFKYIFH